jgi:hypothetical protein
MNLAASETANSTGTAAIAAKSGALAASESITVLSSVEGQGIQGIGAPEMTLNQPAMRSGLARPPIAQEGDMPPRANRLARLVHQHTPQLQPNAKEILVCATTTSGDRDVAQQCNTPISA